MTGKQPSWSVHVHETLINLQEAHASAHRLLVRGVLKESEAGRGGMRQAKQLASCKSVTCLVQSGWWRVVCSQVAGVSCVIWSVACLVQSSRWSKARSELILWSPGYSCDLERMPWWTTSRSPHQLSAKVQLLSRCCELLPLPAGVEAAHAYEWTAVLSTQ